MLFREHEHNLHNTSDYFVVAFEYAIITLISNYFMLGSVDCKKLIYKILFFISLLPYLFLLCFGVYSAIYGIKYSFLFDSEILYGFNGFAYGIISGIFSYYIFLIIPICLTYQISYLALIKSGNKKYIWIATFSVAGILSLLVVGWKIGEPILKHNRELEQTRIETEIRNKVSEMTENADEIIEYGGTICLDGISKTDYTRDTIFIDYDNKTISFLRYNYYKEFTLLKSNRTNNNNIQCEIKLSDPGSSLIAYYLNESEYHRTVSFQLIMKDGSVYSIDNIKDRNNDGVYLGLKWFNETCTKLK